jgi:hypothetical protein
VEDVDIVGQLGVPVVPRKDIILEAFFGTKHRLETYVRNNALGELTRHSLRARQPDEEFDLACKFHTVKYGFGSWLTCAMTQMAGLDQYVEETGEKPVLLLTGDPPKWATEYIELLGYDWRLLDGTTIRVNRLVVPTAGTPKYNPNTYVSELKRHDDHLRGIIRRDLNDWFRESLVPRAAERAPDSVDTAEFPNKVYISRQHPSGGSYENFKNDRKAANFDELKQFLKANGFGVYYLEEMPVWEQVLRMAEADVIVGPHGAGLANIVFAANATVVEIFGRFKAATYYLLANALEFQYGCLDCNPRPEGAGFIDIPQTEININIHELADVLEEVGVSVTHES